MDRFLDAVVAGVGVSARCLFAIEVALDATVPGWRFVTRGAQKAPTAASEWLGTSGSFEEFERFPFDGGKAVTYLLAWVEGGIHHAAHQCDLRLLADDGPIVRDPFFCGGRWDAGLLAVIAAADDAG